MKCDPCLVCGCIPATRQNYTTLSAKSNDFSCFHRFDPSLAARLVFVSVDLVVGLLWGGPLSGSLVWRSTRIVCRRFAWDNRCDNCLRSLRLGCTISQQHPDSSDGCNHGQSDDGNHRSLWKFALHARRVPNRKVWGLHHLVGFCLRFVHRILKLQPKGFNFFLGSFSWHIDGIVEHEEGTRKRPGNHVVIPCRGQPAPFG